MSDAPVKEQTGPPASDEPRVATDERSVTYTFPVKVVLVGALTQEELKHIEDRIWVDINDVMSRYN